MLDSLGLSFCLNEGWFEIAAVVLSAPDDDRRDFLDEEDSLSLA